jgi:protein-disulfide isomerase
MTEKTSDTKGAKQDDVIEIPVGKYLNAIRGNPWRISTVVLAVIVLVFAGVAVFGEKGGATGNVISEDAASEQLLSFIKAQGNGEATLVSVENTGSLYLVTVNYRGQDIPVFVTLDGSYLITDPVPLSGARVPQPSGGSGTNTPPKPKGPVSVEIGDAPMKGNASAPVTFVEFSDYECPFCGKFYTDVIIPLQKDYIDTGKVKLYFKDFPLNFHPNAQKAAEAARCVKEQKGDAGYFAMHNLLFENQRSLTLENYKKWAKTIGVDSALFDSCLNSGKQAKAVQDDLTYGQTLGVSGTPTSFINGQEIVGAQPYSVVKQLIDAELAKTK